MKGKEVRNVAASYRAKLLNRSRERKEDFQFVLGRWVAERFLYRLGVSKQRDQFVLKGATLFLIWKGELARPTRDVDLLGYGKPDIDGVVKTVKEICSLHADDGIEFDLDSIRGETIREDAEYDGIRVLVVATLDRARVTMQIDIGFGDVVDPAPVETTVPVMLDLPAPLLRTYPPEVVIAEKLEAMVRLGTANSRMKDFFDIWMLSCEQSFSMARLRRAMIATFERRKTALPQGVPLALTEAFLKDPEKIKLWKAFLTRIQLPEDRITLEQVGRALAAFVMPVARPVEAGSGDMEWPAGGPWRRLQ
ncbi:MAG: nucleotidyl transferase AbiEii/AbiGii toxin family protein [Bryobacterales bacterium]|nr:nucleotidyl transferase AbiEii/AbiGii toxin family protein [Bryobacterales bacterium]